MRAQRCVIVKSYNNQLSLSPRERVIKGLKS